MLRALLPGQAGRRPEGGSISRLASPRAGGSSSVRLRVLLVGNYPSDRQHSMRRYADLLREHLPGSGIEIEFITPRSRLPVLRRAGGELAKWAGHLDKFLLFPLQLAWRSRSCDVIHICDSGNAPYLLVLPRTRSLITCHDCLAIRAARGDVPGVRTRWTGRVAQRLILACLRRAFHVACVSEATARDLAALTGHAPGTMIPNALPSSYRRMKPADALARLARLGIDPDRRFFLQVGGNVWYKNRIATLRIFAALARLPRFRDHRLVLAGSHLSPGLAAVARGEGLEEGVLVIAGEVDDEELRALYSRADALLFPSLQEGFGWPILEAQACGCTVVTSDREPMRSVAGSGAILVDPLDPGAAARVIERRWPEREGLVARGHDNVRRYSTSAFAEAYAELYKSIAFSSAGLSGRA